MKLRLIFVMFIITACNAFAADTVCINRRGRRIDMDGFLLEWKRNDARQWGKSPWIWDAVNTDDGVAGYFSSPATACSGWTATISIADTHRTIKIPEQAKDQFYTFDLGSFNSEGTYTVEWLVPWDFFRDTNTYMLTLNGANACGKILPPITLIAHPPKPPAPLSPNPLSAYAVMGLIGAVSILLIKFRRKRSLP